MRVGRRLLLAAATWTALAAEPCAAEWPLQKLWRLFPKSCARRTWERFDEGTSKPMPTAEQQADGFIVFQRSVLERIYEHSNPRTAEVVPAIALEAALDEYEPIQLAVYPLHDLQRLRVAVSDLHDDAQHVIPASEIVVRMVRYYGMSLSERVRNHFGVVPKTLEVAVPLDASVGRVRPYWITVHVPKSQPAGHYTGNITLTHSGGAKQVPLAVDVIGVTLREPAVLYGTLCVGTLANLWKWLPSAQSEHAAHASRDALMRAEEVRRHAELIFRDQREHGMTSISLRSGAVYQERDGHPYLPDLEVAMELYKQAGFTQPLVYCLGQLLKTNKINRSANYREFDPAVHVAMARKIAAYYTQRFRDAELP
ncbi:MAG TPA: glycoside hydrolase domain-containing protein, partial [Candidatus Kryptonia bacterium]|nr:glycoside hydrolase domain-containing protein [Candidatus Kryptonia bacterium]